MAQAKKTTKKNNKSSFNGYIHIDTFIDIAKVMFGLKPGQAEGFKAYMNGKHYQYKDEDFLPYLEEYTGKKFDI